MTKRNPKKTISTDAARLAQTLTCAPGTGLKTRKKNIRTMSRTEPTMAVPMEKSRSVRRGLDVEAEPPRMFLKPELSALTMVGSVLMRVMRPAAATAPAPIGRI